MKRTAALIVLAFSLIVVGVTYAYTTNIGDVYYNKQIGEFVDTDPNLAIFSQFFQGSCSTSHVIYIKWDLSNVSGEVSSATTPSELILNVAGTATPSGNLVLYSVDDDSWVEADEAGLQPAVITPLVTILTPSGTGPISFSGPALNTFLNQESAYVGGGDTWLGDNTASLAIQIEGCANIINGVFISDRNSAQPPLLNLYDPSAVELQVMSASSNPNGMQLVWIALVSSVVLILAGTFIYRRRAHQS